MFSKGEVDMDYKHMWETMHSTYQKRIEKLEVEGKKGTKAHLLAKQISNVMEAFELAEKDRVKHCDLSINDIRRMAEL